MSRILIILLILLFGFVGCQTTPTRPLGNIFSPSTTIPPPGTNSYVRNSAPPPGTQTASTSPPSGGEVSPYSPNKPYADPYAPSQETTNTTVQPFASQPPAEPVATGSVKVAAMAGDEVMIPVSAFRTDTGLYSNDSRESQAAGTATESIHVGPFQ